MTRLAIGTYPTPVERHPDAPGPLFVKRDDRSSAIYGGNKTRKLEWLLGRARALGARTLVTAGAAGSHQVVALARAGAHFGFSVEAVLASQPDSELARTNLRVALAHGLRAVSAPAWALVPPLVALRRARGAHVVPFGSSNPLGTLGFVNAAEELAAQVADGVLPEPDEIVVALGSGGTAAGLAVGLERCGLRTRVVGVAISPPVVALALHARSLAWRTARLSGLSRSAAARAAARIEVEGGYLGAGYGFPTPAGDEALARASRSGLTLDPTYTAKAFACALSRTRPDRTILFWHTLSTTPIEPPADAELPPHLASLFR